jgi:hypothetical protein
MLGPLVAFVLLAVAAGRFDLVFVVSFAGALVGLAVLALFVRNPPRVAVLPTPRGRSDSSWSG